MSMKSKWVHFKGGVDYFFSGLVGKGTEGVAKSLILGVIGGSAMALALAISADDDAGDFSDALEEDLQTYSDGALLKFPDDCDLGSNFYLISKKPSGGLELSRGHSDSSWIKSAETQQEFAKDIEKCMAVLRGWAMDGNYKFADDFKIVTDVEYTEAGIVYDIHDETSELRKDIIENGEDIPTLEKFVKDHEDYDKDSDNLSLYRAEFTKAVTEWNYYLKHADYSEPYFDDGGIKNAEQYQKYDYDSPTFDKWTGAMIGFGMGTFLLGGLSSSSPRSRSYKTRKSARDEQLAAISLMDGRDGPIL